MACVVVLCGCGVAPQNDKDFMIKEFSLVEPEQTIARLRIFFQMGTR